MPYNPSINYKIIWNYKRSLHKDLILYDSHHGQRFIVICGLKFKLWTLPENLREGSVHRTGVRYWSPCSEVLKIFGVRCSDCSVFGVFELFGVRGVQTVQDVRTIQCSNCSLHMSCLRCSLFGLFDWYVLFGLYGFRGVRTVQGVRCSNCSEKINCSLFGIF